MTVEAMLSTCNKVLLGLAKLEETNQEPPYSMEDIAISAWRLFPKALGMKGYSDLHPDFNKVVTCMSGTNRGLVHSGHITRVAARQYLLTPKGRTLAHECAEMLGLVLEKKGPAIQINKATPEVNAFLVWTLESVVYNKAIKGLGVDISFKEACDFWQFFSKDGLKKNLGALLTFVKLLDMAIAETAVVRELVLSNGRQVTSNEVHQLGQISDALLKRYDRHIKTLSVRVPKNPVKG